MMTVRIVHTAGTIIGMITCALTAADVRLNAQIRIVTRKIIVRNVAYAVRSLETIISVRIADFAMLAQLMTDLTTVLTVVLRGLYVRVVMYAAIAFLRILKSITVRNAALVC